MKINRVHLGTNTIKLNGDFSPPNGSLKRHTKDREFSVNYIKTSNNSLIILLLDTVIQYETCEL